MERRTWIKMSFYMLLILICGMCYSCSRKDKDEPLVSFNQETAADTILEEDKEREGILDSDDNLPETQVQEDSSIKEDASIKIEVSEDTKNIIYIHLCGAVVREGIYKVAENTRLFQVIELAGGLSEDAAGAYVNQAVAVQDGQRIYIPNMTEVEELTLDYGVLSATTQNASENQVGLLSELSNQVNINTATIEELMTLTGIGESKAKSIIEYREQNNGFQSLEELMNISGIKESSYNKIVDRITIK